jgi:hypothetical protein
MIITLWLLAAAANLASVVMVLWFARWCRRPLRQVTAARPPYWWAGCRPLRWCYRALWLWHALFDGTPLCRCHRSQAMKARRAIGSFTPPAPPRCGHSHAVEVMSLNLPGISASRRVAWWCPDCETQLPADHRPPPAPTGIQVHIGPAARRTLLARMHDRQAAARATFTAGSVTHAQMTEAMARLQEALQRPGDVAVLSQEWAVTLAGAADPAPLTITLDELPPEHREPYSDQL